MNSGKNGHGKAGGKEPMEKWQIKAIKISKKLDHYKMAIPILSEVPFRIPGIQVPKFQYKIIQFEMANLPLGIDFEDHIVWIPEWALKKLVGDKEYVRKN